MPSFTSKEGGTCTNAIVSVLSVSGLAGKGTMAALVAAAVAAAAISSDVLTGERGNGSSNVALATAKGLGGRGT